MAQQFIDKMRTQTTPEGLAKTSPFQAPSNMSGGLVDMENPDTETAEHQAEVTASYKEWTEAATKYAQNEYDINDLTAKIADNRTTLDAITKGTTIPDEYTAKLASDTEAMEKTLAKLKDANLNWLNRGQYRSDQFTTTIKQYAKYLSENGMMRDDSGTNETIKNLPHNSADVIKSPINLLMNGDNNPTAIAAQEAKVNSLQQST